MIMLRPTGSRYFEEAYFVMREGADCAGREPERELDMIAEAERIIEENSLAAYVVKNDLRTEKPPRRSNPRRWRPFLCGWLCGGGVIGAAWVIVSVALR